MTKHAGRLGLLFAMAATLGVDTPLPEPSLDRAPETRRRTAPAPPQPVERVKSQRELAAEAKRARRCERNLRLTAKTAPAPVPLPSAASAPVPLPAPSAAAIPWALTPNQQALLTHLQGGYDRPVEEILPYFPSAQAARATIAAARKVGLVEVLGVLVRITPYGLVSLAAAR